MKVSCAPSGGGRSLIVGPSLRSKPRQRRLARRLGAPARARAGAARRLGGADGRGGSSSAALRGGAIAGLRRGLVQLRLDVAHARFDVLRGGVTDVLDIAAPPS